jgi:hypothetical protein
VLTILFNQVRLLFQVGDSLVVRLNGAQAAGGTQAVNTTESLSVGLVEGSSSIFSAVVASDSLSAGLTDTFNNTTALAVSAVETLAVQLPTEAASIASTLSVADTLVAGLTDTVSTLAAVFSTTESLAVQLASETSSIASSVVASDTLVAGLTDAINIGTARAIATTETLAVQLPTEAASILSSVSASDTLTIGLTDTVNTLAAVFSTTESVTVQLSETSSIASSVVASDSLTIGLTDAINISAARAISAVESLTVQLAVESASIASSVSCADSLTVQLSEAYALGISTFATESLAVVLSEAAPNVIQNSLISATDSLAVVLTEGTPFIGLVFTVTDSLTAGLSDVITGTRAITAEESLAVQLSEAVTNSLPTVASDSLTAELQDVASIAVSAFAADSLAVQLSEVGTQSESGVATPKSASDSCAIQAGDDSGQVPLVGLYDNFDRGDESPVSPTLWPSVVRAGDSVLRVVSQRLTASATGTASAATGALSADSEILVTVVTKPAAGSDRIALYLRTTDPGFQPEGYAAVFRNADVTIQRVTEGVGTDLSTASYTLNNGDQLLFRVIGSRLSAYHRPSAGSWTLLSSVEDAVYQTGGSAGIQLTQGTNTVVLDDVAAGTIRAGVTLGVFSTVSDDGPLVVDSDLRFAPQAILTSDALLTQAFDYTAGASKEDAETFWNGWNGEEHELVYADSWQTGRRDNPGKMRW